MKLRYSALVVAMAFAAAPTQAADVYGKVNVAMQSSDGGDGAQTEVNSKASRLGVKGEEKLDDGLTLIYKYEFQVDVTDESGEKNLKSRNQYVGVKGSFGEIILGRNDTVLKQSQGKMDIFSDFEGDIKALGWKGENRMGDSVTYKTPKINGIQFGMSYVTEQGDDEAVTSLSATYGDKALKKGSYYVAVAHDSEVKDYNTTRITAGAKFGKVKVAGMYQTQENVSSGSDKDGFMVNAQYPVGKYTLKAQYQTLKDDSGISLGVDRKLGKKTKGYVFYNGKSYDAGKDKSYVGIGLVHSF